ncbi:MAG: TonB-dependent receptor [Sediminibacterium sp.]|nr:MAG: TonB-dependent receptor [Sediminibacterium sp.] [Sediminibacterium sp. FEMGT703S]
MCRKKLILSLVLMASGLGIHAQQSDTAKATTKLLDDVVVYSSRFAEKFKRVAQTIDVLKTREQLNFQLNTADALINSGKLFVQKSQQGGGSPVIRGFEASRILMVVDGVRMNNAIYRAGHLQNIITIDNMVLDRMEILYGPSSTLFGSDALGGVISLTTKDPILSNNNKTQFSGAATLRYSSAMQENRGNFQFNIGGKQWASFTSVSYGSFGDLIQGNNRSAAYPNFGKRNVFVERAGNLDIIVPNPNPNKQVGSGYQQVDITQKFLYQASKKVQHVLNFQFSNTNDIPRYDRLSEMNGARPVFAEWYYGPQIRNMAAYHLTAKEQDGFFKDIKITASFQDIEESRITRRFQNNNKDFRWERVHIFGLNIDAKHYYGKHELHLGAESYSNFVRSTAERVNIVSGNKSRITTRYSDGPTSMGTHALFAQHTFKISDHLTINDGLRFNLVQLNAQFVDTALTRFPFTKARQSNQALTGNIGIVYASKNNLRTAFVFSTGFRSPNVDDLAKVFDSRTGLVVVPNTNIRPEYTYNVEWNLNKYGAVFSYGAAVFYTAFNNALVLDRYLFNGQDSIMYNGVQSGVYALQNKARARLYGLTLNASIQFAKTLTAEGVINFTRGQFRDAINGRTPLDHIPPTHGRFVLKHQRAKWNADLSVLFNGWKRLADYNPNGEDNVQYATPDGMPAWYTLNFRSSVHLKNSFQLQVALENILDRNYRYFASGISAPGRNLSVSLRAAF